MATSSSISLIFILVLVFSIPTFEARKVLSLKKGEVSSMDDEGHARVVNINGRLFTLHLPSINDHRMLTESVPSPGDGNSIHFPSTNDHRMLPESVPSPGDGYSMHFPSINDHRMLPESIPSPGDGNSLH